MPCPDSAVPVSRLNSFFAVGCSSNTMTKDHHMGKVSCPGYVDSNGVWNNGFYCPQWGGPEVNYCCGTDTERNCCPEPKEEQPQDNVTYIPLIAAVSAGAFLLVCCLLLCVFCSCCPVYKRRKRPRPDHEAAVYDPQCPACRHPPMISMVPPNEDRFPMRQCSNNSCRYTEMQVAGGAGYTVTYTVCDSPDIRDIRWPSGEHETLTTFSPVSLPSYPIDDPPPYTEEKTLDKAPSERAPSERASSPSQCGDQHTNTLRSNASASASRRRSSSNLLEMATAMASDLEQELSAVAAAETTSTLRRAPKHRLKAPTAPSDPQHGLPLHRTAPHHHQTKHIAKPPPLSNTPEVVTEDSDQGSETNVKRPQSCQSFS